MIKEVKTCKKFKYVFSKPEDFNEYKKYPVIFLLHGAGSRGDDITPLCENPYFSRTEKHKLQAVTFAPQCYANTWFEIFEQLQEFIDAMRHEPYADIERCYVMGPSMGGYGTWQMAMTRPEWFAAAVPICGGGMYWNAGRLKQMPIWAFHGIEDKCVLPEESIKMVNAVNAAGGNARLTMCERVGHDSWNVAYDMPELFEWLFSQKLSTPTQTADIYNNAKQFG